MEVHGFLGRLFDGDLHAKRMLSLANATLGVVRTASLAVNTAGHGLALARGRVIRHAIKQADRLLSNQGIDSDVAPRHWVSCVVEPRTGINVTMDWTSFEVDGQATIILSRLTRHRRATPLEWLTVDTATLKDHRNEYQYQVPVRLADALSADIAVSIVADVAYVADRGFREEALPGPDRGAEVRVRYPLPRQHCGDRRAWRNAQRHGHGLGLGLGLGRSRRTASRPAGRHGDSRTLSGGNRYCACRTRRRSRLIGGQRVGS